MQYISTRGDTHPYSFSEVVLKGLAADGGLFVPLALPHFSLDQLMTFRSKSYAERALWIFELFETDIPSQTLAQISHAAYSTNFDTPTIVPLVALKDQQYLLELWHGPTAAFKDMALQVMPLFFSEAVNIQNAQRAARGDDALQYLILVATSGDTGKAALEGYRDTEHVSIVALYPYQRVSRLQELQMVTQEGDNLAVYALQGDFDAVQSRVKDIFNDKQFNKRLFEEYRVVLSSANSINWGRLLPQIVYYLSAYVDLLDQKAIAPGDAIDIAVPTGNFGNIVSALYAKRMGLPVRRLICASNANNVLTEFLRTGVYDIAKRSLLQTPSPSMDILIASNVERLLFLLINDPEQVATWMKALKEHGTFTVDDTTREILHREFYADWISNDDSLTTIRNTFNETGYLLDPHTAVAQAVVDKYSHDQQEHIPVVIASTAHWAKFSQDVSKALMTTPDRHGASFSEDLDDFSTLDAVLTHAPHVTVPQSLLELRDKEVRHGGVCAATKDAVESVVIEYLQRGS